MPLFLLTADLVKIKNVVIRVAETTMPSQGNKNLLRIPPIPANPKNRSMRPRLALYFLELYLFHSTRVVFYTAQQCYSNIGIYKFDINGSKK